METKMTNAEENVLEVDVPKRIESAIVRAPFDKGKEIIEEEGFEIPYAWQTAQLLMQEGYHSPFSNFVCSWVREGPLYIKGENITLLRTGIPFLHPEEATDAHREIRRRLENPNRRHWWPDPGIDRYANLRKKEIEFGRANGLEVEAKDLDCRAWHRRRISIQTKTMGSNKYGVWLFGGEGNDKDKSERAEYFGNWLFESGAIEEVTVDFDNAGWANQHENYADQLWLHTHFNCCEPEIRLQHGELDYGFPYVRGVRGEGVKRSSTIKQILRAFKKSVSNP